MDTTNICHITSTWLYKKVQYQYSPEKKKKKKNLYYPWFREDLNVNK